MFRKLYKFLFLFVLLFIAVIALALGAVNDQLISLNLLAGKLELSIAVIIGCSLFIGAVFISLIWMYIVTKQWFIIKNLKRKVRKLESELKIPEVSANDSKLLQSDDSALGEKLPTTV